MKYVLSCGLFLLALPSLAEEALSGQSADPSHGAVRGKRLFLRCASCHAIDSSGTARIGPNLRGVVGRKAGSLADFTYSPAMKSANFTWDTATLDRWLERPAMVVPGTAMAFAGIADAADRAALILYLESQSP
jgi:cytochrome c